MVVSHQLVVSGGDAAEALEATEHGLGEPAIAIAALVILERPLAVAFAGADRDSALFAQRRAKSIGVISADQR